MIVMDDGTEVAEQEIVVSLYDGHTLRCPDEPAECTYVRICDSVGEEVERYTPDDGGVMVMGALVMGFTPPALLWEEVTNPAPADEDDFDEDDSEEDEW